jgi:asparagine synthase (glutamine-hydrolysing)
MSRALAHRGPDEEGTFREGPVGLGIRRLSIIDVAGGQQPIANEDGDVRVVFNGEIYNHEALREDLLRRGHRFATRADTEVIVHLYEEHGDDCVDALEGMFAFALWDRRRRRLLLARDRFGQKPLFYAAVPDGLVFASEIKALLGVEGVAADLDTVSMHHYLSLRFVPPPRTMFGGISKLPAAHRLTFEDGRLRVSRYWQLSFADPIEADDEEIVEAVRDQLRRSVDAHLVSDVPVGAMLSGGLDSSTVVALAARSGAAPLQTFAIGVSDQSFNEIPWARRVAEHCGTRHTDELVEAGVFASLPTMIRHLDEPSDPIAACMYHASALASRHVKVALGGDGGDEVFAGFDRYAGVGWVDHYARLPGWLRRGVGHLISAIPEDLDYKSWTQRLRWVDQLGWAGDADRRYAEATIFFRFDHTAKQGLLQPGAWRGLEAIDSADVITRELRACDSPDALNRMLHADFATRLPEHSLMLSDRMSMAHGLELRSPLLDRPLVELMARVPRRLKLRGRELKVALRRAARPWLPRDVLRRPKQGFMFPVAQWLRGPLHAPVRELLEDSALAREGIVRSDAALALLEEHRARRVDHHVRIWMLLNLEIWFRMYAQGTSAEDLEQDLRRRIG